MSAATKAYESVSHLDPPDQERLLLEQLPQVRYIARRIENNSTLLGGPLSPLLHLSDDLVRVCSGCANDGQELHEVNTTLASLVLRHERLRCAEPLGQIDLRESVLFPGSDQQLAELGVSYRILGLQHRDSQEFNEYAILDYTILEYL